MRTTRTAIIALVATLALLAAACGDDGGGDTTPATTETTTAAGGTDTTMADTTTTTAAPTTTAATATTAAAAESLLIWADEKRVPVLQEIAPAFTDATGVGVTVELVPFDNIRENVIQAAPAGEGPDIFVGAHDWTGQLAANGVIAPIPLGAQAGSFLQSAVNAFGFGGDTYGLPYVTEAVALYYNTDLVDAVPATFDEIAAVCEAAEIEACVVVPGGGAATDAYHNYPFVSAFGGSIFQYDPATGSYDPSVVRLDEPETVQGIEYLEAQVEAGVVPSTDYDTAKNLFLEGQAPFWITGPWELNTLRETEGLNWDVALIPPIGEDPIQPFVGAQGFYLSAFSENELLAQTFLLDFIATDETMQALYDADPRGTAWVAVQDGLTDDPQAQTFAASAGNGIPMPNVPEMASVWGPLGDNLLLVRNAELAAADAMTTAAEAVRTAITGG